jgi:eukaryotic-like serine/threonine-protein kinase
MSDDEQSSGASRVKPASETEVESANDAREAPPAEPAGAAKEPAGAEIMAPEPPVAAGTPGAVELSEASASAEPAKAREAEATAIAQPAMAAPAPPAPEVASDVATPPSKEALPESSDEVDRGWEDEDEEHALPLVPKADKAVHAARSSPAASESETLYALEASDVRETTGQSDPPIPIEVEGVPRIESRPPPVLGPASYLGTTIDGRYRVETLLGEGGMGFVYRCRHKVLGKVVAIKILRQDVPRAKVVMERFVMEAKAATAIGNAHIVDVVDFGELPDGSTYFVMEYLSGRSLSDVMDNERPIKEALILSIARQIAEGLGAAHMASIVHRDLKPDNVFLVERGGKPDFVKILDFGIAKVGSFQNKITRAGEIFGTPHYMAPEQAKGAAVDHRADIYALGVMLFELVTGHVPFDAETPFGVLTQHINAEPPPVSALNPKISSGLEAIVMKCLAKKPDNRYPSMEALIEEIDRVERGAMPVARREMTQRAMARTLPSSIPPSFQSPSRRRWPVYALGLLLVGGAGSAVYLGTLGSRSRAAKVAADSRLAFRSEDAVSSLQKQNAVTAAEREVALVLAPIDAHVYRNGNDLGAMPVSLRLSPGEVAQIEVKRQGFFTRKVKVDGRKSRVIVRLTPIPGVKPAVPVPENPEATPVAAEVEAAEPMTESNAAGQGSPAGASSGVARDKPAPAAAKPETSPSPDEETKSAQ